MIKIKLKKSQPLKRRKRMKNKARIRKKVFGSPERPRLAVFRSQRHIYAQLIDDGAGATLAAASSLRIKGKIKGKADGKAGGKTAKGGGGQPLEIARQVGGALARQALEKKKTRAVFDRGGFIYHGQVKAVAEGARAAGLEF